MTEQNEQFMIELAAKLKKARELSGKTQKDISTILGLADTTISNYETAHREPSAIILKKLADLYCVDINWLYGYTDSPEKGEKLSPYTKDEQMHIEYYRKACDRDKQIASLVLKTSGETNNRE